MPRFDLERERQKLNAELKAGKIRLSVIVRNDRLYLRGTLPPKPGSGKTEPHQQDITLGVYANAGGLKHARSVALEIASEPLSRFDWSKYVKVKIVTPQTCREWVQAFEQDYFSKRERTPTKQASWHKDIELVLVKLPQDAPLTVEVVRALIETSKPDSRNRQRYCNALGQLARFAGLEMDIKSMRGSYSAEAVDPRSLPDDATIVEWRERIPDNAWKWAYSVIAAYGLRPHECWYVTPGSIASGPKIEVLKGKTGRRVVWPIMPGWWAEWQLSAMELPAVTARSNRDYGERAQQYFKRLGLPFGLYDLRHAWAGRAAREGLSDNVAAKMMGHSPAVHARIYQRFMRDDDLEAAWSRTKRRDAEADD